MWRMLKSAFTKLGIINDDDEDEKMNEDEIIESFSRDDEHYILTEIQNYTCTDYKGKISYFNDCVAVIDSQFYFHLKNTNLSFVKIGDVVTCKLYSKENLETVVRSVVRIESDETEIETVIEEKKRDLEGMVEIRLTGKIVQKNLRHIKITTSNKDYPEIEFSMDNVRSEFIPVSGDLVELQCLVPDIKLNSSEEKPDIKLNSSEEKPDIKLNSSEEKPDIKLNSSEEKPLNDGLTVEMVLPEKTMTQDGFITDFDNIRGVISRFAEFTIHTCEPGYQPTVGDKVLASLIKSDRNGYRWRAVTVIPQAKQFDAKTSKQFKEAIIELTRDKEGVCITTCPKFEIKINEVLKFVVEVINNNPTNHIILQCSSSVPPDSSQLILTNPKESNIELKGDQIIPYTFELTGKYLGRSTEQFIWVFNGFRIGRIFDIEVYDESYIPGSQKITQAPKRDVTASQLLNRSSGVLLPGRRSFSPAAFVPVKLGQFPLSNNILKAALPDDKINLDDTLIRVYEVIPSLKEELHPFTYLSRMHGLLYLEEVAMLKQVGELQMEKASFRKQGECLVLTVPALSPYTSKLVAGDMLIASLPSKPSQKYEGVIHKVTRTELWLQFDKHFHDGYIKGTKYSISFVTSRASLRRMHQAVYLASQYLGFGWLFPTQIKPRPPQVIVEEINEEINEEIHEETVPVTKQYEPNTRFDQNKHKSQNQVQYTQTEKYKSKTIMPIQTDFRYGPDPRNVSMSGTNAQWSLHQKFAQGDRQFRGRGKGRACRGREINWNRHGSGYGMHCTVDNESSSNINLEQKKQIKWFNRDLNIQQKDAVINVLLGEARPLPYILFGPPGTGKTITVVETILQLHALIPECRLLVATPSNSAADLIAERLLDSGNLAQNDLLRIVGYHYLEQGRISASLVPYSAVPDVKAITTSGASGSSQEGVRMCGRELLGQHRITVGTLGCLGLLYNMGFPRGHFTHIIIDEAGQATEPEILIPMVFLHMNFGQVVLAGDPLQLGPVVTSRLAAKCGLQESLLARLLTRFPYTRDLAGFPRSSGYDPRLVTKLVNNYRSLPKILKLPSMLFYDNDLIANVSEIHSVEAKVLASLGKSDLGGSKGKAPALLFHGVRGNNLQEPESHSWYNPEEVTQTIMYLNILLKAGLQPEQIGVITPYQLQSNKIRFMIEKLGVEAPKVGSVEEFQGQEKMAIIVSVVRSSPDLISWDMQKALGFVANARRLNVALSRARAVLIILGNPHLLMMDMHWSSVLKHCIKENVYIGCNLPNELK